MILEKQRNFGPTWSNGCRDDMLGMKKALFGGGKNSFLTIFVNQFGGDFQKNVIVKGGHPL